MDRIAASKPNHRVCCQFCQNYLSLKKSYHKILSKKIKAISLIGKKSFGLKLDISMKDSPGIISPRKNISSKSKILGSISIMYIMTLKCSPVNCVVKAMGESACWVFILKSHTLVLTCPFLNGVVRYARNYILIQELS